MVNYTHIIEYEVGKDSTYYKLEGELSFNTTSPPTFKLLNPLVDMSAHKLKCFYQFLENLSNIYSLHSDIKRIEITTKL